MAWKKNKPEAIVRFDKLANAPGAERAVLFGCPVYKIKGQHYAILFQNRIVLRLGEGDAARLIAKGGKLWTPMKRRAAPGRIVVPPSISDDTRALKGWIRKAVANALQAEGRV
jgi:TfoX/Sxy family transcriptional regulator of competence genes